MNRTFHANITWYQYVYLVLIGLLAFWMLWIKAILLAVLCMLLLVFLIERFIHTTYTITTDNLLKIYLGRFAKIRPIRIEDIITIERRQSPLGKLTNTSFVLIQYGINKYVSVLPVKEAEFIELLEKNRYLLRTQKHTDTES
ncbi:PH domain-containing protein [Bacteroides sp. 519]|uniref:PH domain-containing protein n=1 Tax=Bacteroides sp. 519 TaxID=2302937 RepID=UPI0013D164FC|nr:PH domain-containing protein [Bacteroides sp. 519]NDV57571.1 ABC transporter [Bacteroides sp. 519]